MIKKIAEQKLNELYIHLALSYGNTKANQVVSSIVRISILLKDNPELGPRLPSKIKRNPPLRFLNHKHNKLVYQINRMNKRIEILHVFDTRARP